MTGGKGFTPEYSAFRNQWFGQATPVDYSMLKKAYLEDPIVFRCVNLLADAIMARKYLLRGADLGVRQKIMKILKRGQFDGVRRDLIIQLIVYGDAYLEVQREGGRIVNFFPHDAATIRIDYDEHGVPIKYIQRVLNRRIDYVETSQSFQHGEYTPQYGDVTFELPEIIHFSLNNFGGRVYGTGFLTCALQSIQTKFYAENYTAEFFRRGGIPRLVWLLSTYNKADQLEFDSKLRTLEPQEDISLRGDGVDVKELGLKSNADMQFRELLEYLRGNVMAAFGIPPDAFLSVTSGKSTSSSGQGSGKMEAFDDNVDGICLQVDEQFNAKFFTERNFGAEVDFEIPKDNTRELLRLMQTASLMATMPGVYTRDEIRAVTKYPSVKAMKTQTGLDAHNYENVESAEGEEFVGDPAALGTQTEKEGNPRSKPSRRDNSERQNGARQSDTKKGYIDGAFTGNAPETYGPGGKQDPPTADSTFGAQQFTPLPPESRAAAVFAQKLKDIASIAEKPLSDAWALNCRTDGGAIPPVKAKSEKRRDTNA